MHEVPVVKRYDDPKSSSTAWVTAIGGLILLLLILGLQLIFRQMLDTETAAKNSSAGAERLAALRGAQAAALSDYVWIDKAQGTLRMPIEDAMARVVTLHARDGRK
jgi:hypothetical protein